MGLAGVHADAKVATGLQALSCQLEHAQKQSALRATNTLIRSGPGLITHAPNLAPFRPLLPKKGLQKLTRTEPVWGVDLGIETPLIFTSQYL